MKAANRFISSLRSHIGTANLIEVDRTPMTRYHLRGFVVGATDRFLTLNLVDDSYFMNGFTIIRLEDVQGYRIDEKRGDMIRYVLSERYPDGYRDQQELDAGELEDFSFLERIHESYPLVAVHREEMDDTVCSIGESKR